LKRKELSYASAGHGHPILWRYDEGPRELESTGPPLGIADGLAFPLGETIPFRPGDMMAATTDGVEEAVNRHGKLFGRDRLKETLGRLAGKGAEEIMMGLRQALADYTEGVPPRDDLTLVTLVRTAQQVEENR